LAIALTKPRSLPSLVTNFFYNGANEEDGSRQPQER